MSEVTVACCQLAPQIDEPEENRARGQAAIAAAASEGARVIVLPELSNSGYVFADAGEARELAEPVDGPTVSAWVDLSRAHEVVIVGGLCELDGDGAVRNSAVLVDAGGVKSVYRKAHLWDREGLVFTPGSDGPPVVGTSAGRIGVMVCYDLEFPEWTRVAGLAEADIVCAPTNWPQERRPTGERTIELVRVQAAASVNRMFFAVCDRTGSERGVDWVGGSAIVGPDGYPLALAAPGTGEQVLFARCDLAASRDKQVSPRNDVLGDRRPELYAEVAAEAR
jgi:5-aminopentanamidase